MTEAQERTIEDLFKTCKTPFEFVEEMLNNKFDEAETIESFSAYYTMEMVADSFIKEIQTKKYPQPEDYERREMKKQLAKFLELELDIEMFYCITLRKYEIDLQGDYNEKLIEQLRNDEHWKDTGMDGYHNFKKDGINIYLEENRK